MAKLRELPSMAIISGFKGTIDFYIRLGQPIARKWPSPPKEPRSPSVQAQWPDFSYLNSVLKDMSPEVVAAYNAMVVSTPLRWNDLALSLYLSRGAWDEDI